MATAGDIKSGEPAAREGQAAATALPRGDSPTIAVSFWGRRITDADLRADGNILTIWRWVLASSVMFSHGFALTGRAYADPTTDWLPFPISRLAVLLFFSLSGFLVVGSLMRRGWRDFAVSRALRLIPGFGSC